MEKLSTLLTAFNWGAICFVSVVHYPLFSEVSTSSFVSYHKRHVMRTTLLLGITLSLEMVLDLFLFFLGDRDLSQSVSLMFLILGWFITFVISVPQHRRLEQGFTEKAHGILMLSNWGRVVTWGACLIFKCRLFI